MIPLNRADGGMQLEPVQTHDGYFVGEEWRLDADGTAYRVIVMTNALQDFFILAEPQRRWMVLSGRSGVLAQDYVAEKLGINPVGQDAANLTRLIAAATGRTPIV